MKAKHYDLMVELAAKELVKATNGGVGEMKAARRVSKKFGVNIIDVTDMADLFRDMQNYEYFHNQTSEFDAL